MRDILAFMTVISLWPGTAAGRSSAQGRVAQVIEMRHPSRFLSEQGAESVASNARTIEGLPQLPFQTYLLGPTKPQKPVGSEVPALVDEGRHSDVRLGEDRLTAIQIPLWMRGSPPNLQFVPDGCSQLAYRPSGFLDADAERRRAAHFGLMRDIACQYGIPVGLFDAMIISESRYNPSIVSPKGAFGLTQLMPLTAVELGVDRYDRVENLQGGARYLRAQLDRYGTYHLALAAYNAGPGRIRNGEVPQIGETQRYVAQTLANWERLGRAQGRALITAVEPPRPTPRRIATVTIF